MPEGDLFQEAERQLVVCNACRYCEGYCAVFPALELRQTFTRGDITYLANLCHDCRACYYACMYTPPHEFAVNIPKVLSEVRQASYRRDTWPPAFGGVFTTPRTALWVAAAAVAAVVGLAVWLSGLTRLFGLHPEPGAFYQVVPYWAMVAPGLAMFCWWLGVWVAGGVRFWRETACDGHAAAAPRAVAVAVRDALSMRWLRGGGPGCAYPGSAPRGGAASCTPSYSTGSSRRSPRPPSRRSIRTCSTVCLRIRL